MFRGDERTDARALLARIADRHVRGSRAKLALEFIGNRRLNQQPSARKTHLARIDVLAGGSLRGGVEVGVGAHHIRRLAAELEADGSERSRSRLPDQLRGVGRPGKTQPVYIGMGRERRARLFTYP